jgi:hypothetical protein
VAVTDTAAVQADAADADEEVLPQLALSCYYTAAGTRVQVIALQHHSSNTALLQSVSCEHIVSCEQSMPYCVLLRLQWGVVRVLCSCSIYMKLLSCMLTMYTCMYAFYCKQVILNHVEAFIIFSTLRRIAATVTSHPLPAAPTDATSNDSNSSSSSSTSVAVPAHVHDAAGQQLAVSLTGSDNSGTKVHVINVLHLHVHID